MAKLTAVKHDSDLRARTARRPSRPRLMKNAFATSAKSSAIASSALSMGAACCASKRRGTHGGKRESSCTNPSARGRSCPTEASSKLPVASRSKIAAFRSFASPTGTRGSCRTLVAIAGSTVTPTGWFSMRVASRDELRWACTPSNVVGNADVLRTRGLLNSIVYVSTGGKCAVPKDRTGVWRGWSTLATLCTRGPPRHRCAREERFSGWAGGGAGARSRNTRSRNILTVHTGFEHSRLYL